MNKIIVALDNMDFKESLKILSPIRDKIHAIKINHPLIPHISDYKKEGYSVMGYVSIDRVNGNIKVESSEPIPDAEVTKWLNTTSSRPPIDDTQYGKCSKWSGKKKF